ncbi:MAG: undecaprenyl-diphosphate phosphatase [Ignavibacteriae bacterium]|nr:undecaprenyl-diphosphate phosphatase [Ignavibacteriota bacterium]MCB9243870.1 undecaprenyl-diphosphate phosphatase [Ignavibacteriales bacterium]
MDEIIKAVVYGAIQGLTEFIPISSTAHLRVIPALLGWKDAGAAFSAVIQMGTLIATLIYFRTDIINLTKGFFSALKNKDFISNPESRIFILIIIGTIPIGICGLLFKKFIEGDARGLYVISASLILLAIVLFIAEKVGTRKKEFEEITIKDGIIIGLAQALALIPGSSRSGVTITAGLFRGLKRDVTARYSFLLSIPAIGLSGLYELYSERTTLLNENFTVLIIATVVSGVVGYLSIAFLIRYLKTHSNMVFIIYRIVLGLIIILLLSQGILSNLE